MKRFNILYWLVLPVLFYGIYKLSLNFNHQAETFFGFAENKEMQINLEHPLMVNRIAVTPGQAVKKGDLLLEVTRVELDLKLSDVAHNISELEVKTHVNRAELQSNINRLKAQRTEKVSDIQSRIRAVEAEIALNELLVKDLKSVKVSESSSMLNNPNQLKISALKEELRLVVQPLDIEIQHLESELGGQNPMEVEINRLKTQREFIAKEQKRLAIYAPSDGLVGSITCKAGENIASFTSMISFYEKSPNMVVGYVHESLIVQVAVGDSLNIVSSLHPEDKSRGRVIGLGHRIVEIPERLRKIPEMKTYGREVLIQIPSDNHFLQSETVILSILNNKKTFFQTLTALMTTGNSGLN